MEFVDVFLMNGTFPLMRIWKHLVYDTIRKYELSEWTQRLNDDDEFDSFKSIHQVYQPHPAEGRFKSSTSPQTCALYCITVLLNT